MKILASQNLVKYFLFIWLFSACARSEEPSVLPPSTQSGIELDQANRLKNIEEAKKSVQQLQAIPEVPQVASRIEETCFNISIIEFEGNTLFHSDEMMNWLGFQPSCIGLSTVNEYLRIITNRYIKEGYITSRAFLVPQDLSSGTLKIVILEGRLESMLFNGKQEDFLQQAFSNIEGKILNLRDIEQGLDQINRLNRYNARIKLEPGTQQGYSIVDIKTDIGSFDSINLGISNSGQRSTGEELFSGSLETENILGLLDKWVLTSNKNSDFDNSHKSESIYFNLDIPYGYWNLNYNTSYSAYKTSIESQGFLIDSKGKTNTYDLSLKKLFYRDSQGKYSLTLGINHRREKNYLMNLLIDTSSRNLSSTYITMDTSRRLWGGIFTFSPSLLIGTDWFGGENDTDESVASAQFYKYTLTASATYLLSDEVIFNSSVFAQGSDDKLYGNQQVSIGGEYSVRGYKGASISGDKGYYWRNDLTYPLALLRNSMELNQEVTI